MVPKMAVGRPAKISMASRVVTVGPPRSLVPEGGSPGEKEEAEAPNEPASRPARRVSAGVQVFDGRAPLLTGGGGGATESVGQRGARRPTQQPAGLVDVGHSVLLDRAVG